MLTHARHAASNVLLSLLIAQFIGSSIWSQETSRPTHRFNSDRSFWINPDGKPTPVISSGSVTKGILDFIPFIRNENVQNELELTDSQKPKLDSFLKTLEETENAIKELNRRDDSITSPVVILIREKQSELKLATQQLVDEQFLPHQNQRMIELRHRFQIRRIGLFSALIQQNLSEKLRVTPEQKIELKEVAAKLYTKYLAESNKFKDEYIAAMTGQLNSRQLKTLNENTSELTYYRNLFLEIMMLQSENEKFEGFRSESQIKHAALAAPHRWRIGPDGLFLLDSRTGSSEHRASTFVTELVQVLRDQDVQSRLELSDAQRTLVNGIRSQLFQRSEDLNALANEDIASTGGKNYKHIQSTTRAEWETQSLEQIRVIEEMLLPFQSAALDHLVSNIKLTRAGLLFALSHDRLGEELGVSEKQNREIEKATQEVARKIRKRGVEIEREVEEELIAVLDREQRKQLDELLGPPIRHGHANIDLTIQQLDASQLEYFRDQILLYESLDED